MKDAMNRQGVGETSRTLSVLLKLLSLVPLRSWARMFSADPLVSKYLLKSAGLSSNMLANLSRAHWIVCSMLLGNDLSVQYGT